MCFYLFLRKLCLMNTTRSNSHLLFFILFSIFSVMISCEKETKKTNKETNKVIINPKVSELMLTQIAEANLKVVAIAQKAKENKVKKNTRMVLKDIENDHLKLKNEIRKIAKENFVIIPNTLYDTTTLKKFISEVSISLYLKKLENSLHNELELYQSILTTTQNNNLKELAKQAISSIKTHINAIQKEQKLC